MRAPSNREYASCSEVVKLQVIEAGKKIEKELSEWEKDFIIAGSLPLQNTPITKSLMHKKNIALNVLVYEWNM